MQNSFARNVVNDTLTASRASVITSATGRVTRSELALPSSSSSLQREREALARLQASGVFSRSPNLEKILRYLCEKYFAGQSATLKEYHVATEALGRAEDFDPKRDSIVRVEMHRLRRRLREHYEGLPEEPVQILLPEKSYVPQFRAALLDAVQRPVGVPSTIPPSRSRRLLWLASLASVVVLAGVVASLWPSAPATQTRVKAAVPIDDPVSSVPPAGPRDEIRILAGRPAGRYIDRYGNVWQGDRFFTGGTSILVQSAVLTRGFDSNVFSGMREGNFQYEIPLRAGSYELLLLFAETMHGEHNPSGGDESRRFFSVEANGKTLLSDFNVLSDAFDPNTATARLFRDISPGKDGKLRLQFRAGKAFVNGIVIRPGIAGRIRPIRIVCRSQPFRDSQNNLWEPDPWHRGGVQISRPNGAPAPDSDVFRGERYGHFSYSIPVPPGKYSARLYFWEYWWGKGRPGNAGAGSRIFDVFANHTPLLIDFDIIKRNPKDQVAVETFHGLQPNGQGQLILDFVPKVNYAMVNAIEIFD